MKRVYITEKKIGIEYWYFAVRHATMMLNQVSESLGLKLDTPFELVHNAKPYSNTWFELFSMGSFNHHVDNT